jgi:hypothetical protein
MDPLMPQVLTLTSGSPRRGTWDGAFQLPAYMPAGVYSICSVNLADKAKNLVFFSKHSSAGSSTLPAGTYAFDVINDKSDTTAPIVSDVTVSSRSPDVTSAPVTVTTDFTVIEDGSGIDLLDFGLRQDSRATLVDGQMQRTQPVLLSASPVGADGSGRYRAVVTLPAGSAPGGWHIGILARDRLMHSRDVEVPVTVIDRNPITSVPQLASVTRTPGADPHTQTYSVHVTSTRAAVTRVDLQVRGPGNRQWANGDFTLTSGTPTDGVWTATVQVADNAESGTWSVSSMSIDDSLGRLIPIINPVVTGGDFTIG